MGLDMYLYRRTYVKNWDHNKKNGIPKWNIEVKYYNQPYPNINPDRIDTVSEEIMYWRKANAIHNWFVENVQEGVDDCKEYYVELEKLEELKAICKQVIDVAIIKDGVVKNGQSLGVDGWEPNFESGKMIMNEEQVSSILPSCSGFFFGSNDYDQWYMMHVQDTYKSLSAILNEDNSNSEFYYQSSW